MQPKPAKVAGAGHIGQTGKNGPLSSAPSWEAGSGICKVQLWPSERAPLVCGLKHPDRRCLFRRVQGQGFISRPGARH